MTAPVRGPFDDIVGGQTAAADPFADIVNPPAPRRPLAPVPVPLAERASLEAARASGPSIAATAVDMARQFPRGLAESGYATAQGVTNLVGADRAAEAVRRSRQGMREFYGDPETGLGTAASIAGNIAGTGAQFMVPGAVLTRGAAAVGAGTTAGRAMQLLANPLGGTGARAAAGRAVGGTVLNAPLNLATAASPEDNTAAFIAQVSGSEGWEKASKDPATAFAIETGVDLLGNTVIEAAGAGIRKLRGKPAFPDMEPPAAVPSAADRTADELAALPPDPVSDFIDTLGKEPKPSTEGVWTPPPKPGPGAGTVPVAGPFDDIVTPKAEAPVDVPVDAPRSVEVPVVEPPKVDVPPAATPFPVLPGERIPAKGQYVVRVRYKEEAPGGSMGPEVTKLLGYDNLDHPRLQELERGAGVGYQMRANRPDGWEVVSVDVLDRQGNVVRTTAKPQAPVAAAATPPAGPFDDIVQGAEPVAPRSEAHWDFVAGKAFSDPDGPDYVRSVIRRAEADLERIRANQPYGWEESARQVEDNIRAYRLILNELEVNAPPRALAAGEGQPVPVESVPRSTQLTGEVPAPRAPDAGNEIAVRPPAPLDEAAALERAAMEAGDGPDYWQVPLDELRAKVPRAVPTSFAKTSDDTLTALTAYRARVIQQDFEAAAALDDLEAVLEAGSTGRKIGYEGAKRLFGTAEDARRWRNVTEEQVNALSERGLTPQDVNAMYKARDRAAAGQKALDRLYAEMEARGLSMADELDDSFDVTMMSPARRNQVLGAPARRGGKPRGDAPSLFGEGTTRSLFGDAPTMAESDVGMRKPQAPQATGKAPDLPGKIDADEMTARRDELGFEKQDIPGADEPGQGTLFGAPTPNRPTPPPPPSSAMSAPKPRKGTLDQLGVTKELQSELAASALGAVAGSAAAGEDNRTVGALLGAAAAYGVTRGGMAGAKAIAKQRALREGVKTLRTINTEMMRAAGVSVKQGRSRMLRQNALGWFNTHTEAIRQRRLDALDTGAHEIGHYISKRFFGNPANKKAFGDLAGPKIPLTMAQKKELVAAGKRLYGNSKPAGGYGEEGIAEFFKFFVTDPARAKAEFPLTYPAFMQALDTDANGTAMRQILETAQRQFDQWKQSPAYERVSALVSVDEQVAAMPTLTDFRRVVEDDLIHAKVAEREMRAIGGKPVGQDVSPTDLMYLSRGSAGEAARALDDGIFINGKKVADGIADVLKQVRSRTQDFRMYLIAKRTLEDLAPRGIESGISKAEAEALVKALEPEMKPLAEKVWAFENAKVRLLESSGLLTPKEAAKILDVNKHHVAFQRVFGAEEPRMGSGAGRAKAKASSGVMRMKGSSRQIIDPLETLVKDTYDTFRRVREHQAATALIRMGLETEGGARWFELVEAPKVPQSFRLTAETVEQLVDLGVLTADQAADISGPMMTGQIAGFLSGFTDATRAGMAEGKDMVIPVVLKGQRKWVQVKDKGVYEALLGMNAEEMGALERFVATWPKWAQAPLTPAKAVARTLRAGATLTTEFIARNPVRDAWGAAVRTRAGRMVAPGEHLVRGVLSLIKKDEMYDAWLRSGGANATMVSGDRSVYQKSLRDLQATAAERGWYLVTHPVDFLRAVSEISENATRLGEFKLVKQRALTEGLSERAANVRGGAASRDITVDFAKAGQAIREANKIVAFLNAYVQGNINIAKDLVNRPATVLPRIVVAITLPSIAIEAVYHDNETYKEVPDWVKRTAWVIPLGDGPDSPYLAIPKPFELGTLFGTIPQRIVGGIMDKDPRAGQRIRRDLVTGFKPPVLPTIAAPLVENFANRSTFQDRPIVPRDREGEEGFAQAGARTGETARVVGGALNYSPAKIENVVRGYTGGLGGYALEMSDAAVRLGRERTGKDPLRPVMPPEREGVFALPGARAFVKPGPGTNAESIEQFYQTRDEAERKRQTYDGLKQEGRFKDAQKYLMENLGDILAMGSSEDFGTGPLRAQAQEMTRMRELRKDVMAGGLSKAERDAAMRSIERAMLIIARGGLQAADATRAQARNP